MPASPRPPRAPLGPRFRLLWSAVSAAGLGDGIALTAMPLLAGRLTGDPRGVSLVFFAEQLPWLVLGLISGVVADRLDRRRVLWISDALRAVIAAAFTFAVFTGRASIPLLGAVALLLGAGQVMYVGAWGGMVPAVVEPVGRTRANAALQATAQVTGNLLGSPLGAVLFAASVAAPFAAQTACIACAAVLIALLPGDYRARTTGPTRRTSLRREVIEGVGWLWNHRLLRLLCVAAGVANLVVTALTTVLVLYTREELRISGLGYGLVMVGFAVGGIAGAAVVARVSDRLGAGRTLTLAMAGQAGSVALAGAVSSRLAFCGFIACYGAAMLSWNVVAVSVRQSIVPDHLLGRVNMAYQMIIAGASAVGALTSGVVAHVFGLRAPFVMGAVLLFTLCVTAARGVGSQHSAAGPSAARAGSR
ncbi:MULTISPECIES: MFS transporter [unclassified Streptomyces]|uniref:MFS transporter n=1 Tax=unclassified Streptomyces TaxID=2593676 RepID=UPI00382E1047